MLIRTAFLLLSAAVALGLAHSSFAQDGPAGAGPSAPRIRPWVEGALGVGRAGAGPNTEVGGHFAGRLATRVVAGRLAVTARVGGTTGGRSPYHILSSDLHDVFFDAGLLAGYPLPLGRGWEVLGSAGLGVVWGSRAVSSGCNSFCFSTGEREPFGLRPSVPIELALSRHLRDDLRLGLLGYLNLNTEETFGGLLLSGSLRLP